MAAVSASAASAVRIPWPSLPLLLRYMLLKPQAYALVVFQSTSANNSLPVSHPSLSERNPSLASHVFRFTAFLNEAKPWSERTSNVASGGILAITSPRIRSISL